MSAIVTRCADREQGRRQVNCVGGDVPGPCAPTPWAG